MYTIKNSQVAIPCSSLVEVINRLNDRAAKPDLIEFRTADTLHIEAYDGRQWPVAFAMGSTMAYPQLHDSQSALEWLDRLLIEVRVQAISPTGSVLPPQRMPRSVWNGLQTLHELAKGYGEMFTLTQRRHDWVVNGQAVGSLIEAYTLKFKNYFGYGPTGPERSVFQSASHEWYVAHALLRGEELPQPIMEDYATIDWVRSINSREVDWVEHLLRRPYLRGRFTCGMHLNFAINIEGKPDCSFKEITTENVAYLANLLKGLPSDAGWLEMDDLFYEKGILTVRPPHETTLPSLEDGVPLDELAQAVYDELVKKARKANLASLEDRIKQGLTKREIAFTRSRIEHIEREFSYSYPNKVAQAVQQGSVHFLVEILDSSVNVSTQRAIKRAKGIELERLPSNKRIREIFRLVGYDDDAQYQQARALYDAQVATYKAQKLAEQAIKERERQIERVKAVSGCVNARKSGGI